MTNIDPTTPLDTLDLGSNKLTRIPKCLPQFTQLVNLVVSSNSIAAIQSGDLSVTGPVKTLDLSSNIIAAIADASLPGAN